MTEVEKKGIGKAEIGLIVCGVIVAALAMSNILVYLSLQNQIETLETGNSNLRSQMTTLQIDKSSLQTQVNNLTSEKNDLQNQVDDLTTENEDLQWEVDFLWEENYYLYQEIYVAQFDFYYVLPIDQKFGVYALDDELYSGDWVDPYEKGVFDCSEMSAYMEWELENLGWHTIIVAGDSPFSFGYHAWLLVETSEGAYMPVEATTLEVVWWDDPYFDNYWIYDYEFEEILDALEYSETEFDWWN